ncbi:MAG TPA: prepilin-type N-terminal cleavage/methylation domain-containing protein [Longimicrobiaceae bacterium]|nr:prepilin-type N-terminal cleavage/methylation domain-containing protein [Longimicrobiaceae bacterium]
MTSDPRASGATAGFTMIEVLVAMIILSVGLLGVEALGIGAARAVAFSAIRTDHAIQASGSLEVALSAIRNDTVPSAQCLDLAQGDRLSRTVDISDPTLARVSVTIIPGAERTITTQPYTLTGAVYTPAPLPGVVNGFPCS